MDAETSSDKGIVRSSNNSSGSETSSEQFTSQGDQKNRAPSPPDGGWGWVVMICALINFAIVDGIFYSVGVLFNEYVGHFDRSVGATSLISSLMSGSSFLIGPVAGALVNKYGCRVMGVSASIVATSALIVSSFSPNLEFMISVFGFVGGCSFGMMSIQSVVAVGQYFEKKRAIATGVALCGTGVGTLAIAPLCEYILDLYGWKGAHLVLAGLMIQCCVSSALMRPLTNHSQKTSSDDLHTVSTKETEAPEKDGSLCDDDEMQHPAGSQFLLPGSTQIDSGSSLVVSKKDLSQPLCRTDIFLSGSIYNVAECKDGSIRSGSLYAIEDKQNDNRLRWLRHLPKPIADVLVEMMDVSLLKEKAMAMLCFANIFCMFGCYVPIIFIVPRAEKLGVPSANATFLLSILGILNTAGRLLFGALSTIPRVSPLLVNNISTMAAGLSVIALPFCKDYTTMAIAVSSYGFFISTYISLASVIICNLVGLKKLTNGFGLVCMARGMTAVVGPPITGKLFDVTGNYDTTLYVGGGSLLVGALLHFSLHLPYFKSSST